MIALSSLPHQAVFKIFLQTTIFLRDRLDFSGLNELSLNFFLSAAEGKICIFKTDTLRSTS
ncbi:MAG: hypothetical protein D3910_20430 [Candidatus Electrothrix sp. ATG2]|nr:hypothetical protein [Candidatus Electrothrix sp. ATG2]